MSLRALSFCTLFSCSCLAFAQGGEPSLIPRPSAVDIRDGQLAISPVALLRVDPDDASSLRVARALAQTLARYGGPSLHVVDGSTARGRAATESGGIVIRLDAKAAVTQREGYVLDITPNGASLTARNEDGLFYGAMSLAQLLLPAGDRQIATLPAARIADWPRFAWRGLMIDSARHMQSVPELERILDQMALHKLNVLHWHLSDDQGWRIEIKHYPELTRIGAWRTPPDAGKDGEPKRYGGFYSQDDVRHIVAYAAERHITVVPELDMPGHAQAAVASYPEVGVTGQRPAVSADWGINPYLYNVDEPTLHFLENVLDEVMALFPSRYIHLGGDEAIKDQWEASPAVRERMRALGLKNPEQLESWLMGSLGRYLDQHGRRLIGWDEILEGGVPGDAAVMSWRGTKGIDKATRAGHDVVVAPDPYLYFDYVQSGRLDETAGRLPVQTLKSVYTFDILPPGLPAKQAARVLGAQANVWSEHMPSAAHLQHAIFPRLDALAENAWTPTARHDWQDFLQRLPEQLERYRREDIAYGDSAYAVDIEVDRAQALRDGKAQVHLANQLGKGEIRYTLDGSEPSMVSLLYRQDFTAPLPATIKAASFSASGTLLAATRQRSIDAATLHRADGSELKACPAKDIDEMRAQPTPDATSLQPVYVIDNFDTCRLTPALNADGMRSVAVELARLPRNIALAHDAHLIVPRQAATPHGELELRLDRCDGKPFAVLPLPDPTTSPAHFVLDAALSANGTHTLCLIVTGAPANPYYGVGSVQLDKAAKANGGHR
ncbi:family 20 glycosylhydrolase [Dyella sp. 2RAB6]|uniref:family 20 glycosylhydrolase n=1 Tax=Dyella sp. 2RAB6 TaxID=3232992 RepID=UPI003F8E17F4